MPDAVVTNSEKINHMWHLQTLFFSQKLDHSLFVCIFHLMLICKIIHFLLDAQRLSITQLPGLPDRNYSKLSHVVPIKCFLTKSEQQKRKKMQSL